MLWLSMESSSGASVDRIAKRQTYKALPLNETAVFDPNQNINASITSAAFSLFPWNNKQLSTLIPSLAASCIIIPRHHGSHSSMLHSFYPHNNKAYYSNFFDNGKRTSGTLDGTTLHAK